MGESKDAAIRVARFDACFGARRSAWILTKLSNVTLACISNLRGQRTGSSFRLATSSAARGFCFGLAFPFRVVFRSFGRRMATAAFLDF